MPLRTLTVEVCVACDEYRGLLQCDCCGKLVCTNHSVNIEVGYLEHLRVCVNCQDLPLKEVLSRAHWAWADRYMGKVKEKGAA